MAAKKTEFIIDPGKPTVTMRRVFDAPRRLVWEAMTRPEHLARWYGPHGFEVVLCEMDTRPGGAYRIVQRAPDGQQFGFRGVNQEVVPHERIVYTWIFEPMPDKAALVTSLFEEKDGKTTLTSTTAFQSLADRDAYLSTGASEGAEMSMNRLEEVIASLS
jgi:uncharacterized protein YndB with AHSA1/START domain